MTLCRRRYKEFAKEEEESDVYPGSWDADSPGILFDLVKELETLGRQAAKQGDCLMYSDDA